MTAIGNFLRNHIKGLLIFTLIIGGISFSLYNLLKDDEKEDKQEEIAIVSKDELEEKEEKEEVLANPVVEEKEPVKLYVDIKGAVNKPGVYEVNETSIINDVVLLAGGFTKNAYQNNINLSKKVKDEMVIFVYTKEEMKIPKVENKVDNNESFKDDDSNQENEIEKEEPPIIENNVMKDEEKVNEKCEVPSYDITECVDDKQSIIEASDNNALDTPESNNDDNSLENEEKPEDNPISDEDIAEGKETLVNINTADINELTTIKGIGEAKAQAIITYREENGNFKTIDDIKNVSGIGDATFEKIKAFITV